MSVHGDKLDCSTCEYRSLILGASPYLKIGGVFAPRLALAGEFQLNSQNVRAMVPVNNTIDTREAGVFQATFMATVQYWATPRLWIKGGIGFAKLLVSRSDDGVIPDAPKNGFAVMGAAGFELLSRSGFSLDLQGRLVNGSYDGVSDNVTSGSIGVGINWY